MREIMFRGKDILCGDWVEGDLIRNDNRCYPAVFVGCIEASRNRYDDISIYGHYLPQVDPETVGQYTGLKDKNGKRIFEGDVINVGDHGFIVDGLYRVIFDTTNHCWALQRNPKHHYSYFSFSELNGFDEFSEVVGNIHDNPELLKREEGKA